MTEVNARARELIAGCDHVETREELGALLERGRPLTVKLGLDPTTADLHLGHAVVLHKLQQFVDGGHRVVLVIGDMTAMIGDPSGRNELRPPLTREQIEANMQTYTRQAGTVLDMERVEVRYNSEWLGTLGFGELLRLLTHVTVAQMLEREDFHRRYAAGTPIALHEFLYPIAQAYDSIALESQIELGGNDQLFNLLMGRQYQRELGQAQQVCMTLPLLEGLDGEKKMSKSTGNYVGLTEPPEQQFGKLMSIPDHLIVRYARLAAFRSDEECKGLEQSLASGRIHPMEEKKRLAHDIVARYHGASGADAARDYFERTVQRKEVPQDHIAEMSMGDARRVAELLVRAGFAESKRAAERLISGNGVRIDGLPVTDPRAVWTAERPAILAVGSRRFVRIVPNK